MSHRLGFWAIFALVAGSRTEKRFSIIRKSIVGLSLGVLTCAPLSAGTAAEIVRKTVGLGNTIAKNKLVIGGATITALLILYHMQYKKPQREAPATNQEVEKNEQSKIKKLATSADNVLGRIGDPTRLDFGEGKVGKALTYLIAVIGVIKLGEDLKKYVPKIIDFFRDMVTPEVAGSVSVAL